ILFPNPPDFASNPSPKGPPSLNIARPKRSASYVDLRPGEISHPDVSNAGSTGQFFDETALHQGSQTIGRHANDSVIPEFIDQYPGGLPIICIRANAGGTAVCGIGGKDENGNLLTDPVTNQPVTPQYDLAGVLEYTLTTANGTSWPGPIGLKVSQYHGL